MPTKAEKLVIVKREVKHRNLSARALARMTGLHQDTVGRALHDCPKTRDATVNLLYSHLILERDSIATEGMAC